MQRYGSYYVATETTTAPELGDDAALPMDDLALTRPLTDQDTAADGDPAAAGDELTGLDPAAASPENAGQLGMLPSLILRCSGLWVGGGGCSQRSPRPPKPRRRPRASRGGGDAGPAVNPNTDAPTGDQAGDFGGDPSLDGLGGGVGAGNHAGRWARRRHLRCADGGPTRCRRQCRLSAA